MTNFIYGFHNVAAYINTNLDKIIKIYYDKKRSDARMTKLLEDSTKHNIEAEAIDNKKLDLMLNSTKHQGIAVLTKTNINTASLIDILSKLGSNATILMLDGITNPQNLGAIIRTAESFLVDAIILPKNNSANLDNPLISKASSGAIHHIPVISVSNLATCIRTLQNEYNFWSVGASLDKSTSLFEFKPMDRILWILGNEGTGLRRLTQENCDYLVNIPTSGITKSLNVSVAAGIVLAFTSFIRQQ